MTQNEHFCLQIYLYIEKKRRRHDDLAVTVNDAAPWLQLAFNPVQLNSIHFRHSSPSPEVAPQ